MPVPCKFLAMGMGTSALSVFIRTMKRYSVHWPHTIVQKAIITAKRYISGSLSWAWEPFVIRNSESERTYISGIGLFFADRPSVTFGYKSLESYLFDAKPFGGINLAFSDVGIHALQILADSSASTWTGTPNDATDRIKKLVLDEMDILGLCFDVSTKWYTPFVFFVYVQN